MSDSATPWTVAYKASLSMEFSRQEYWSGLPFPSPGDLPNPGIEPGSPALRADALPSEPPGKPTGTLRNIASPENPQNEAKGKRATAIATTPHHLAQESRVVLIRPELQFPQYRYHRAWKQQTLCASQGEQPLDVYVKFGSMCQT